MSNQVLEEVDRVMQGCPDGKLSYVLPQPALRVCGLTMRLSSSAAASLTYLNCVIKETLRMNPPVGTPHEIQS